MIGGEEIQTYSNCCSRPVFFVVFSVVCATPPLERDDG